MPSRNRERDNPLALDEFLCFAVYSLNHAFTRVYKPLLDHLGLTYPQYLVMVSLWENDAQTVGELGRKLSLMSSTLTPLLKRLETAGHVARSRDPADERQVRVSSTQSGRALRKKALGVPRCVLEATGMTGDEVGRLRGKIAALQAILESAPGA